MKRLVPVLFLCSAAFAADLFVFSRDCSTVETKPRELPSAAVKLTDGTAIFGLYALPDETRAECGWYRVLQPVRPEWATNHVFSCTNYIPQVNGTALPDGVWRQKKPRTIKLDRDKVKAKLRELGQGAILENWASLPIELVQWYFCEMNYVPGGEIAKGICKQFGWTEEQLAQFAEECKPDKTAE